MQQKILGGIGMKLSQQSKNICIECGVVLIEGKNWNPSFVKRNYRKCKQCWSKYSKAYYRRNSSRIKELNKERILSQHSKSLGSVDCPKCGELGQLKLRTTVYKSSQALSYLQVDHYKNPHWHGSGYDRSCYLGKKTNLTTKFPT